MLHYTNINTIYKEKFTLFIKSRYLKTERDMMELWIEY